MRLVKSWMTLFACWLAAGACARAQVKVELVSEATNYRVSESMRLGQFLPNETLMVGVQVINLSGQTLELGKGADWLTFNIESLDGHFVRALADVPVVSPFTLESTMMGTKRVDLAPYFELNRPGVYRITATVKIPQWDQEVQSSSKRIDIISGSVIWEQDFGLPPKPGAADPTPEVRKYELVQARLLDQLKLYVKLSDSSGTQVIDVFPLGPMVGFTRPEAQLDRASNLHVLYQYGARAFRYYVVNPEGRIVVRQAHDYAVTRPRLDAGKGGGITVTGGVRRLTPWDIPEEKPETKDAKETGVEAPAAPVATPSK